MATAIGLDVAVDEGDQGVRMGEGEIVVDLEVQLVGLWGGSGPIGDPVVNHRKTIQNAFRERAFLKCRGGDVPGGVIKIQQRVGVFEMNPS